MFIASKIEEIYPPKLADFAYVTDGACGEDEILSMELVVLKELNWGLSPMTPNAWVKMFMQVANCDHRPDQDDSFVIPQFSGQPFARVMMLLDLVTYDMDSLNFTSSVLATAALCHFQNTEVALAASGYTYTDVAACIAWMAPHAQALKEDMPAQLKTFHTIAIENQHNIQSHSVEVATLTRAHQIAAKGRESPNPSVMLSGIVDLTPPPDAGVNSFVPATTAVTTTTPISASSGLNSSSSVSVFMTPQSPENERN